MSVLDPVFELACGAQSYDWGKLGKDGSLPAKYAQGTPGFSFDPEKPYAELWMGTHPSCPSAIISATEPTPSVTLKEYIAQRPDALLGDKVRAKYGDDLPFLFKILAIRKALSIQAHPDKALGARLHKERPDIYKDPNHKPEMAVALTSFSGFCGFRPADEIAAYLSSVPEFADTVGEAGKAFASAKDKAALKTLFHALMSADDALVKRNVRSLVDDAQGTLSKLDKDVAALVRQLDSDYANDVGVLCTFMLNIVSLSPGEAVFLKANEPHAYLSGDIVETMATSDNVVRAGLTPKLRDVPTLTEMLTYTTLPPREQLLEPVAWPRASSSSSSRSDDGAKTLLYDPPIDEFSVLLTTLSGAGAREAHEPVDGPSIIIFTELKGSATLTDTKAKREIEVKREGAVYFIGAGVPIALTANEGNVVAYRSYVEA